MHGTGAPFAVYHFHQRQSSLDMRDLVGGLEIAVGRNMIVFNQAEITGNIWLLEPEKGSGQ